MQFVPHKIFAFLCQENAVEPTVKKEPVTATHLRELLHIYGNPKNSLKNLRLLAICFTAYAGFLRYDELIQPQSFRS